MTSLIRSAISLEMTIIPEKANIYDSKRVKKKFAINMEFLLTNKYINPQGTGVAIVIVMTCLKLCTLVGGQIHGDERYRLVLHEIQIDEMLLEHVVILLWLVIQPLQS